MNTPQLYRTMREQIAEHIRTDVVTGRLQPGERLREQDLAERYGVSRGPVRDALLQLTQEGVLEAKPYCGVSVRHPPNEDLQPLIVTLRRRIETFAVEKLAAAPDQDRLEAMQREIDALHDACRRGDMAGIVRHDMAFHRLIVGAAGNDAVILWLPIVARVFLRYSRLDDAMAVFHEHAEILDAVREGRTEAAVAALERNIQ